MDIVTGIDKAASELLQKGGEFISNLWNGISNGIGVFLSNIWNFATQIPVKIFAITGALRQKGLEFIFIYGTALAVEWVDFF